MKLNQRGGITVVVMSVVAGIMAMTLGSSYSYISNRARWQARIRDAYRLNFVVESMAKYVKDASDRFNACVDGSGAALCTTDCLPLGPATQFKFVEAPLATVVPPRRMCFTILPECGNGGGGGIQNSDGLGIKFLDNAAVGGQTIYCMSRANVGDLSFNHDSGNPLSKISLDDGSEIAFVATPLRSPHERPTWKDVALEKLDRWIGTDIHAAISAIGSGDLSYRPKPWIFSLLNKAEAFVSKSLYSAPPPTTGPLGFTIARGPNLVAAPACDNGLGGLVDEQCLRRCMPNRPCVTFAVCPAIVPGCGADGLGAGPADNSLLVRSTIIVMGMGATP